MDVFKHAMRWINALDRQEWLIVLVIAMIIGFFVLQGFGSRTDY